APRCSGRRSVPSSTCCHSSPWSSTPDRSPRSAEAMSPEDERPTSPPLWWYTTRPPDLPAPHEVRREIRRRHTRDALAGLALAAAAAALLIALNFARLTYETLGWLTDALGRSALLALVTVSVAIAIAWPQRTLREIRRIALVLSALAIFTLAHALWMFLEV